MSSAQTPNKTAGIVALALALATLGLYAPVLGHAFINFDDDLYVTANPMVRDGWSWRAFAWAWTTGYAANWHPVTWLSHLTDCSLFGLHPAGHHATNAILHAANTVLLFLLLRRMTGAIWRSALVAALFGWHPLHVESVAWVAERKDVLSTFFFFLTLWAYLRYTENHQFFYVLSLFFFALGLMSKPMLVTLPFVLWLLDYWPLGRFVPGAAKRLVLEKLPFLGLAAACSIITYLVQKSGGAVSAATSLEGRLLNAVLSYGRYLGRMIWPRNLALIYPYTTQLPLVPLCGSVLVLIVLTWLVLKRREQRYLAMGWFWYLGTLAPVIGVVLAGAQSSADRFTYIPSIGIFVMIVWGVADLAAEWRLPAWGLVLAGASVLAACAVATEGQLRYWTDSGTLFSHTLDVTKDNYMSWNNLGVYLLSKGDQEGGFRCFTKAATVASDDYQSWYNLGTYYSKRGRKAEAWRCFNQSLRFRPDYIPARMSLADSLADAGKNAEAVSEYRQVLQSDPGDEHAHCNLACALAAQGQTAEALKELQQALRLNPSDASAHCNLGNLLIEQGKLEEAANEYRAALNSKPNSAEIHSNLGAVLALQGRREQAVDEFNQALRLAPDLMQAREGLKTLHGR